MLKNKTILTVTAICLAAVLLCGGACLGTAFYVDGKLDRAEALAASASTTLDLASQGKVSGIQAVSLGTVGNAAVLDATEIYELACKQVVGISTAIDGTNAFGQTISNSVTGTGFVLTADGYILTNNHVVANAYKGGYKVTVMLHDGSEYEAKIVGVEDDNDIAVLKIDAKGLTPVALGDSDTMKVGEPIYVVGNPLGELTYTMTGGIVSALNREITAERNTTVNMFQLDAAVNSGNSGGPVYNNRGQVVGVVTAKYKSTGVEGLSFAIPVNDAAAISAELIEHGYVSGKPYLGITVTTMTQQNAANYNTVVGAYVYSVEAGSCAEAAGMAQGDVITKLGDKEVTDLATLSIAKKDYKAGDTVPVTVYRAGEYKTLQVTFDEEPRTEPGTAKTETPVPSSQPQLPQDGGGSTVPKQDGGSFRDFMEDFFSNFYDYFGGDPDGETGSDKDYSHFGS